MRNRIYKDLLNKYPYISDFFETRGLLLPEENETIETYLIGLSDNYLEEFGLLRENFLSDMISFVEALESIGTTRTISSMDIFGGINKEGKAEEVHIVKIKTGDVISIVGPTGSGKSRLLEDIECLAQGDTPTKRRIFIDNKEPQKGVRFSLDRKLVAQISQNMNFVMDCSAYDFVKLHGESRLIKNPEDTATEVIKLANELAGEKFKPWTPLTSLSGGQSRALMIADTACLSLSPIVLIDEIENAGIDRKRALDLLVKKEKIVFLATHDPLLALMADRRIIINKGGMSQIITITNKERLALIELEKADEVLSKARERLRYGEKLITN